MPATALWPLPHEENEYPYKILHMGVYGTFFFYHFLHLEVTRVFLSRSLDKDILVFLGNGGKLKHILLFLGVDHR